MIFDHQGLLRANSPRISEHHQLQTQVLWRLKELRVFVGSKLLLGLIKGSLDLLGLIWSFEELSEALRFVELIWVHQEESLRVKIAKI